MAQTSTSGRVLRYGTSRDVALPYPGADASVLIDASIRVAVCYMSREPNVPLLLWISTAILAHIATGGGADQISRVLEERTEIRSFARSVRDRLRPDTTFEVAFVADGPATPPDERPPDPPPPQPHKDPAKAEKQADLDTQAAAPAREEAREKAAGGSSPPQDADRRPPPPPPPPPTDHRIAVKQHADPNQDDNPTAHFIGGRGQPRRQKSRSRRSPRTIKTTPIPRRAGATAAQRAKSATATRRGSADSDDHAGDPTHAPGRKRARARPSTARSTRPPKRATAGAASANAQPATKRARRAAPAARPHETPAPPAPPQGGAGPASPEVDRARERHLPPRSVAPRRGRNRAQARARSRAVARSPPSGSRIGMLGLGGGATPDGVNLNLTAASRRRRGRRKSSSPRSARPTASAARARTAARGRRRASSAGARPSRTTSRPSSPATRPRSTRRAVPFASVPQHDPQPHPPALRRRLPRLARRPAREPPAERAAARHAARDRPEPRRRPRREDGHRADERHHRVRHRRARRRAARSPFGKPPKAIVSPDGNVYFHWEFHRDPVFACSTMNARPFMLNVAALRRADAHEARTPPIIPHGDPREQDQGTRQGWQLLSPPESPCPPLYRFQTAGSPAFRPEPSVPNSCPSSAGWVGCAPEAAFWTRRSLGRIRSTLARAWPE